jgi:hypothetical protein
MKQAGDESHTYVMKEGNGRRFGHWKMRRFGIHRDVLGRPIPDVVCF